MPLPTPHLDKLTAAIANDKMPAQSKAHLENSLTNYRQWINDMNNVEGTREEVVSQLVSLLNDYKFFVDFNLIYSSEDDFIYRQKGQLKIDNSVIEEFLPHLTIKAFPDLHGVNFGPTKCFSAAYFKTNLIGGPRGAGLTIRTKDQDFAISKKLYLKSSYNPDFTEAANVETYLGYVAAECKTNLDKTMFQEATATANDVKSAVPGAKYFLMCEWLDMTPVSTAPTDIEEVLLMRKAKRIPSNIRKSFNNHEGRTEKSDWYRDFLESHPFDEAVFMRFIGHIDSLITAEVPVENTVLVDGYF